MSAKIYDGYRSSAQAMEASILWLRISIWRNVVKFAKDDLTPEEANSFVEEHAEAGIHVWHDSKENLALYSLFGLPGFLKLRRLPPFLREYRYWNNTDLPSRMTRAEWDERKETWNRVALDGDRWDRRLTNIVLQKGSFGTFPLMMEKSEKMRNAWKGIPLLSKHPLPKTPRDVGRK